MTTYKAGQEIDAYCTRCKRDLTHKIVAVVGNKPVRVECRTCYGIHNYRQPRSAAAATPAAPRSAPRAAGASPAKSARSAPEPPPAPPDHAHIMIYRPADRFSTGSWISHKTFGVGLVLRELSPTKIEVRFESDTKVLVHNAPPPA